MLDNMNKENLETKEETIDENNINEKEIENKESQEVVEEVKEEKVETKIKQPINVDEETMFSKMSTNQKELMQYYNKTRKTSNIIMFISLGIIMLLLMCLGGNPTFIATGLLLVGIYFFIMIRYTKKTRQKLNEDSTKVVEDYFLYLDSYITNNPAFEDVELCNEKKLSEDTFKNLHICKNIVEETGRDYVQGKLHSLDFVLGDNCIRTREEDNEGKTKDYIVFLGKLMLVKTPLDLSIGERAIVYLKGKGANGPTDIDDLEKVDNILSEKFDVYSNFDVNKIFTNEVKETLEKFTTNETLIDAFIVFDHEHIAIGLSYSDGVMVLPLTVEVNKPALQEYKNNMEVVVELIGLLK